MLQHQLMLKQLQELQKHRQFPGIAEGRQQNHLNQQPEIFMPTNTSFMQHDSSAAFQGFPNGSFLQTQTPDNFLSLPPEQLIESPCRTSVASSIDNYNQYSHFHGLSSDSSITPAKGSNNQPAVPPFHSKSFNGVKQNISPDQHSFADGAFQFQQFPNGKNIFGQVDNEGFQQMNTSSQEFNSIKEQSGLSERFQGKITEIDPSQGATPLDPLEQKILFSMDDNSCISSFGRNTDGCTNTSESSDYLSSFASIQSGSWSALMQSAAAESSSDNGVVQEEWSGLSFQTTELSRDNQPPPGNAFPFPGFQLSDDNSEERGTFAKSSDQKFIPSSFGPNMEPIMQQGNHNVTSAAGSVNMRNPHQEQYPSAAAVNTRSSQATLPNMTKKRPPFDLFLPRGVSQSSFSLDQGGEQFPILESVPVESSRKSPGLRPNALPQTPPSGREPRELPSVWQFSSNPMNTTNQAPPGVAQDQHGHNKFEGVLSDEPGAGLTNPQDLFSGEEHHGNEGVSQISLQSGSRNGLEPVAKHPSLEIGVGSGNLNGNPHQMIFGHTHDGDTQVTSVSERDLEAFGRSLKPSNLRPNNSGSSGIKNELGSVSIPSTSMFMNPYAFGDVNTQSIKPSHQPLPQNTAEEMRPQGSSFAYTDIKSSAAAFHGTDHSQINNMQMASCFKQYGELRNAQMLSMHDRAANNSFHPSPLGKHVENFQMKTSMVPLDATGDSRHAGKLPSLSTSPLDLGSTDLSMTRSRKRKTATSDLLPWHTEVTSSTRLKSASLAETEWAKAVNRLTTKVDFEVSTMENVDPLHRSKKRLVLTTQLMQMVFLPAPADILREKYISSYDTVAYFSAKLALGDACNLTSCSRNGSGLPCTSDIKMIEDSKRTLKASENCYSTIVEAFTSRAKKLEANFEKLEADSLRLNKATSFSDVSVECKELEKFSIINRFAKFHIRGKPKSGETSTSNPTSSVLNLGPLRYVRAFTARALPEKAQCLAL